jgi:pyrroline-5-carboxylate reductase
MSIRVSALDMTQVACSSAFAPVRPAPRGSPPFRRRVASRAARRALAASASADDDAPEALTPPDAETQKAPAPKARRASIGFVGGGAMAEAIARGFVAGGAARFSDLAVSHGSDPATAARWRALDVDVLSSNAEILDRCDVVIFAVKPHILPGVLNECGAHVDVDRHLFVSVAAGVSSSFIEDSLKKAASKGIAPGRPGPGAMPSSNKKEIAEKNTRVVTVSTPKVVRVMPNTPCLVGEAASAACKGSAASDEDVTFVVELMRSCGLCLNVSSESLLDAVTGVSGSGPAYAFLFIEALADGGVAAGLPRSTATVLAAQTVLGAAKMVLETGEHPGALKDKVCSPGGATIQAVRALESNGFRSAAVEAVLASATKSRELGIESEKQHRGK